MIDFYKGKCRRFVNGSTLYQDGRAIRLEQEILPLILAINRHSEAYTESSCKGHFGVFVPSKVKLVVSGNQLILEDEAVPFVEAYPDLDVGNIDFFYDRGDVRLVISDCNEGRELDQRLRDWAYQRRGRVHIKPNEASESRSGIYVSFSPDVSQWTIDNSGGYLAYRLRSYPYDQVLEINTGRIKSIEELQLFFEQ